MRVGRQKIEDSYRKISFFANPSHEPKMKRIHQTVLFISIALSIVHTIVSYSIGDVDPRVSCMYGMICMLYYDVMLYSHTSQLLVINAGS